MGRSARRHQGVGAGAPVREDLINDRGRLDDGDDPHGATTLGADRRVDLDDRHRRTHVAGLGLSPDATRAGGLPAVVAGGHLALDEDKLEAALERYQGPFLEFFVADAGPE